MAKANEIIISNSSLLSKLCLPVNFVDVKVVGDGVFEMREHFGPGWRMYYIQRNETLIIMLGGGDKSTQSNDIAKAIKLSMLLEE